MTTQNQPSKLLTLSDFKEAKPVILAGFAPSRFGVEKLDDRLEMWSVNHSWQYWQEEKLTAVFDIHPMAHLRQHAYYANRDTAAKHIEYLHAPHNYPIYMVDHDDEVPASVRYPLEAALELLPASNVRDDMRGYLAEINGNIAGSRYFASSFAFMMALAMIENRNPIYVWGFDMATDTEWFYQRPNCEWWVGFAQGRGFDVIMTNQSPLCKIGKMYGYEGYQMVDRGVLEQRKLDYTKQFKIAKEQFDKWQGVLLERHRIGRPKKEIDEAANQVRIHENTASMCDGALQAINNLLDECDLTPSDIPVFGMAGVRGRGLE